MLKREKCLIRTLFISLFTIVALAAQPALVDDVDTAIENFRGAGAGYFIDDSHGYAVFPSMGKGGICIGGAHGKGEILVGGKKVGRTKMSQITYGLQLRGQVYPRMIFFRDERRLMISPPVCSSVALRRVPNLAGLLGEVDQSSGSP